MAVRDFTFQVGDVTGRIAQGTELKSQSKNQLVDLRFLILGAVGRSKVIFNPSFGSALPRGAPVYVACYMYVLY